MKSIICGAGVVGKSIAESLSKEDLEVTVIDESRENIKKISSHTKDIDEYISEFKDISNSVIFGNSSHIKKINIPKNWIVDYSILSNNEIIKLFNDKLMEKKLLIYLLI